MAKISRLTLDCASSFRVTALPNGRVVIELEEVEHHGLPSDPDPIYTKDEVARRLSASPRAVDNYMRLKRNPIPFVRVGGRPRFRESDIQKWLGSGSGAAARRARSRLGVV